MTESDRTAIRVPPTARPPLSGAAAEDFWAMFDSDGPVPPQAPHLGPCWSWTGRIDNCGYGVVRVGGRPEGVHRVVFQLAHGPIPAQMQIDHICHNDNPDCQGGVTCLHRRCGNPIHIEAATSRVNTLRGKGVGAQNASVTHCPKDHPYDEENTSRSGVGRRCKTCDRERARNPRISAERESIDRAVRALYEAHGGRPNGRQVSVALAESGLLDALGALTETQIRAITWWSLRRIEQAEPELAMKYPSQRKSRGVSA